MDKSGPFYSFTSPSYNIKSFYIKSCLSSNDEFLLTGSSSNAAYLWDISRLTRMLNGNDHHDLQASLNVKGYQLQSHDDEITSVSFSNLPNNLTVKKYLMAKSFIYTCDFFA